MSTPFGILVRRVWAASGDALKAPILPVLSALVRRQVLRLEVCWPQPPDLIGWWL